MTNFCAVSVAFQTLEDGGHFFSQPASNKQNAHRVDDLPACNVCTEKQGRELHYVLGKLYNIKIVSVIYDKNCHFNTAINSKLEGRAACKNCRPFQRPFESSGSRLGLVQHLCVVFHPRRHLQLHSSLVWNHLEVHAAFHWNFLSKPKGWHQN